MLTVLAKGCIVERECVVGAVVVAVAVVDAVDVQLVVLGLESEGNNLEDPLVALALSLNPKADPSVSCHMTCWRVVVVGEVCCSACSLAY
jgi:hypothetical protein